MKKSFIKKIVRPLLCCAALAFSSCANLNDSASDTAHSPSSKSAEYGSLTVSSGESVARVLDVSAITSATVTVSGYGMQDIEKTMSITDGKGRFSIENIPVGDNRVVTVKSNVDGATLRAVVDIKANSENSVTVNWASTAVGNVFYYLIKKGQDVSSIEKTAFDSAIDSGVHPSLIDAQAIANSYPSLGTASGYIMDYGTVSVTSSNASGYTVQITDVATTSKTISSDSETFELRAYPGTWKAQVLKNGEKVAEKNITVVSGKTSTIDVSYSVGEAYDFTGKTIIFVKADSAPKIWAWEENGVALSEKAGGKWETESVATLMTAASSNYMKDTTDWYMIDYSSFATGKTIKFKLNWAGSELTSPAGGGTFWYDSSTSTNENPSPITGEKELRLTVTNAQAPVKIYVSAKSVPTLYAWTVDGGAIELTGGWSANTTMNAATDLNDNTNWYVRDVSDAYTGHSTGINIITIIDGVQSKDIKSGKNATFWYDGAGIVGTSGEFYDSDPTTLPEPELPTVSLSPADGGIVRTTGAISVSFTNGNSTITLAKVTINGNEYDMGASGTFTKSLSDLGITGDGVTVRVSARVVNSVGETTKTATYTSKYVDPAKEDPFTWDNANVYFVLTDRFYNGDTRNDHSYYRNMKNLSDISTTVATFHGGDIAGLTQKLDYFEKLGVNAIWITAPYEQAHGWVGGKNNAFPHYAFHGYYTLDWTSMDQNMGTVEELRTFVNACHSKGIRVVMDVVMNHVGYNNTEDMITYNFGYTDHKNHGWLETTDGKWNANDTVKWDNDYWDSSWFGPWIRSFGYDSGSEYGGSCGGLPDVKTELTSSVGMAPVLVTKWKQEQDSDVIANSSGNTTGNKIGDYRNPSVAKADWNGYSGDYRTDKGIAPAEYQVVWLSAWVREVGIDGFRCDTAKHVEPFRWGQLKVACQAALEKWRADDTKDKTYNGEDTGAADWDENFWMTGECWGWADIGVTGGDYYGTGKFDSMINFSFNKDNSWDGSYRTNYPTESSWANYLSINSKADSDGNGNRDNVLTYISSHDTGLTRVGDQKAVGTGLTLLPGGVQIYYGDETAREKAYTSCGDGDMMTRGEFNWSAAEGDCAKHWGKVGKFRKYNPAVGAGTGTAFKRTYSGEAGESKVAIGVNGTTVDVSGLWSDGTTVYNWYDGKSATVSGGNVTFEGGSMSQPILVSDKNPAAYGVTF